MSKIINYSRQQVGLYDGAGRVVQAGVYESIWKEAV